jgi:hypothetical protein
MIIDRFAPVKTADLEISSRAAMSNPGSGRLIRGTKCIVAVTLLAAFQMPTPAMARGRLGHRVIARIAEKHMTPEAKAAVAAILEPGESIADASL